MDKENPPKQVCRITLIFPVVSDNEAIEYKKKIADVMAELPDAQTQFSLMNMPIRPPMGN